MKKPFFSIVIPTFNEELLLPMLLDSISKQDMNDYEVIVADNNSTGRTPQIITKYNYNIVKGSNRPGVGRNNGAIHATGKYLLFLDADTHIEEGFLSQLRKQIIGKKIGAASGFFVGDHCSFFAKLTHSFLNNYFWILQKIDPHACGFYFVIKKSLFNRLDGFDEEIFIAEDHDLAHRAGKIDRFTFLRNPRIYVSVRRVNTDGFMRTVAKGLYVELYRIFNKKIKKEIFKYQMGGDSHKTLK